MANTMIWVALVLTLVLTSCAQQATGPQIKIDDAWARPSSGGEMNDAIYFRIENVGNEADTLLSSDTPSAQAAEVHESMADVNGIMRMKPRKNIEISSGGEVVFQPGGLHIMLVGLNQPLTVGDEVQLTLRFEKAGEIPLNVEVRES
jgi:copper(I)-binding protein